MADLFDIAGVDELYDLEPSAFIEARNRLSAQIRKTGDRESAEAIKKLPRPSPVAWALNRLARDRPGEVEKVLQLGDQVRRAQADMLGGGDPGVLREATSVRRAAIADLAAAAAEIAGENRRSEAAATIEAASMSEEAGEAFRAGRLTKALEPRSGFGLSDLPESATDPATEPTTKAADQKERRRLERAAEKAEAALAETQSRVDRTADAVVEAEQALERAQKEAQAARRDREEALRRHEEAVAQLAAVTD